MILPPQPYGLPLNFKTLPETLQDAGKKDLFKMFSTNLRAKKTSPKVQDYVEFNPTFKIKYSIEDLVANAKRKIFTLQLNDSTLPVLATFCQSWSLQLSSIC